MTSSVQQASSISESVEKVLTACPGLRQDTAAILGDMYGSGLLFGTKSSEPVKINPAVGMNIEQGAVVNQFLRESAFERSLEIGFGYGFSTVWILDALRDHKNASHVAVDPYELNHWQGVGIRQVERLTFPKKFDWKEEFSIHALSDFVRNGEKFDFLYLCGGQRFDDVIVNFCLSDKLVRVDGVIAMDDLWLDSAKTALSFILTNMSYELVSQPSKNIAFLKKLQDDNRKWNHYNKFEVYPK